MFKILKSKKIFIFTAICSLLVSCASQSTHKKGNLETTDEILKSKSWVPPPFTHDDEYFAVYNKWHKDVILYHEIELRFHSHAVLMVPEMQQAYEKRMANLHWENIRKDPLLFPEDPDILPVVVTAYTPLASSQELDDKRIWNVNLFYHGKWLQPESVNYYRNKVSLAPFFDTGFLWSRMYVLLFKIPEHIKKQPQTFTLSLQSAIANADFVWRQ